MSADLSGAKTPQPARLFHTELGVRVELLRERGSSAEVRRLQDGKEFSVARSELTAVEDKNDVSDAFLARMREEKKVRKGVRNKMETGKLYFNVKTQATLLSTEINNPSTDFGRNWPKVIDALDACGVKVEAANFDLGGKNIAITHGIRAGAGVAA